jgi:hypothetical protein
MLELVGDALSDVTRRLTLFDFVNVDRSEPNAAIEQSHCKGRLRRSLPSIVVKSTQRAWHCRCEWNWPVLCAFEAAEGRRRLELRSVLVSRAEFLTNRAGSEVYEPGLLRSSRRSALCSVIISNKYIRFRMRHKRDLCRY